MNSQAQKLSQLLIEDKYSKQNIREEILKDLEGTLQFQILKATKLIEHWLTSPCTYASKQRRKDVLIGKLSANQIVLEICIVILPINEQQPIQAIVAVLGKVFGFTNPFEGAKAAAELLAVAEPADLYSLIPASNSETGSITLVSKIELGARTLAYIASTKCLPPMVCTPKILYKNSDNAYLTVRRGIVLRDNYHEKPLALNIINIQNQIPLELEKRVLIFEEVSNKPLDTPYKELQHTRFMHESKTAYEDIIKEGNCFYLTHSYDFRGRIYTNAYHVNYMGSKYKRASINLVKKELIK